MHLPILEKILCELLEKSWLYCAENNGYVYYAMLSSLIYSCIFLIF